MVNSRVYRRSSSGQSASAQAQKAFAQWQVVVRSDDCIDIPDSLDRTVCGSGSRGQALSCLLGQARARYFAASDRRILTPQMNVIIWCLTDI